MEINKQTILARKAALQGDADRLASTLQALHGAIQDCDWFLAELGREGAVEAEVD